MGMKRREAIKRTALVMGGLVFAPNVAGILRGARARPGVDWYPTFFNRAQADLVADLTDVILPATDTPGARELGVPAFVEEMVAEVYEEEDRERFMEGLSSFNARARQELGSDFVDLDAEQKHQFAAEENRRAVEAAEDIVDEDCLTLEEHRGEVTTDVDMAAADETPFFLLVKELTMLGYFTTEVGATQVLQYEAVPGTYEGCAPVEEIGRTWAT